MNLEKKIGKIGKKQKNIMVSKINLIAHLVTTRQ